ncbi:MAG: hypothetical protein M5U15_13525 [Kiritimatiellae bacterium]|nr:hypothetical protein [Kiritimatiellia bacterium]
MSETRAPWIGTLVALLLALGALIFSAQTFRATPAKIAQITRRQADWLQLRQASAKRTADRATLMEMTRSGSATPLAEILRAQRPSWAAEVREKEREPITENWSLQRAQVTIASVNLADLGKTLDALAAERPPWRAAEISISASEPGTARVSLLMEGLVQKPTSAQ